MITQFLQKVVPSKNVRELRRIQPIVEAVGALEPEMQALSDEALRAKTAEFRSRLDQGEAMDDLLVEAFAVVREAGRRTLEMRHFDVQIVGGVVLHEGKIAEMKTGEGKTLVATLPVYLNALGGRGVHLVTVNDYLARRDSEWMGRLYTFLGLTVGVVQHDMEDEARRQAYGSDVAYGTNNEFGFDFLRDNMKFDIADYVQREHVYAIVDEVDSILIDEARTPLIISGPAEESTDKYYTIDRIIPRVRQEDHYTVEEKTRTVALTEEGVFRVEEIMGVENLYDPHNIDTLHHVHQALKAHVLFKRDVDYVVKDGEVIIVDEFTGRLMPGRRYSEGLHQALEAKEKVTIANENQTLASITFQNYFRMYDKLAGMTGTADTEAAEFAEIYDLDVMVIPTNVELIRTEHPDVIYRTSPEKWNAVVEEIAELYEQRRPVLVGTISIENSEMLSGRLKRQGIPHHVLNAKHHEREAEIVAQAGRLGAVTLATNMAGRGTDILLGGNPEFLSREALKKEGKNPAEVSPKEWEAVYQRIKEETDAEHDEVVELGGLHILSTERHEARRIDNQLRGRSGRQGDPGSSRFYLALDDDLMRIFASERVSSLMEKLGMEEGVPIEHTMVTKAIETAQKKVEAHNFDIRKHLLEYDDVMSKQREVVYGLRSQLLEGEGLRDELDEMIEEVLDAVLETYAAEEIYTEEWDLAGLREALRRQFDLDFIFEQWEEACAAAESPASHTALREHLLGLITEAYQAREAQLSEPFMRHLEKIFMLQSLDGLWKDHLLNMDHLRDGIGLRGYGQKDPLNEYKREGFEMFQAMTGRWKEETVELLFKVRVEEPTEVELPRGRRGRMVESRESIFVDLPPEAAVPVGMPEGVPEGMPPLPPEAMGGAGARPQTYRREGRKVGRNEPCPCGSGKKHKKCCGA
ncbi:preprotein translocase subunit SecA [Nitrospinae bacterium AH_259_B05_G02_I21]|nr:preprotein translocase subunit SecA [Nitrospinae bacterium AH_259_B05_G02_I21]